MDQFSKDGRKLRPRKKVSTTEAEHPYHESYNAGRREGGYHKAEGGYSQHREGGYRSEGGQHREGGYHKSYGQHREGGYRKNSGYRQKGGYSKSFNDSPRPAPKYSDDSYTPVQEEVRLNKFIANSGVCSRREADTMIQAGVVTVNGEVVTELGTKVNVFKDVVKFNGETLRGEAKVYLVMNKPRGYVTTASVPHAE